MIKKEDFTLKTIPEIKALLEEKRQKLHKNLLDQRLGKLKNTNDLRVLRHDIARLLTSSNSKLKGTH
ncbi:MAG TPA: 50S ribosomal protein L29 [Candidatus Paceibacterota bacterium]|nr:50S ribosomal protein L29 [Candidatus Paceibacterota bacterium]